MNYFKKSLIAVALLVSAVSISACASAFAEPVYDVHRSNVQACGADAGTSATGFTAIAGTIHSFVSVTTEAKYDFSCKSNLHVIPDNVDPYNETEVMAYLAAIGFDARLAGQEYYRSCGIPAAERDPDASGVEDARKGTPGKYSSAQYTGCYKDDNIAGTYGEDATYETARFEW